jgi:dTMP kinase
MHAGRFITFEGIDGCGKSTQARLLLQYLRERGEDAVETIEPGGTEIGRRIRRILLDPANTGMHARTELLLYFASRAQNIEEVIRPALALGQTVISDRFTDSTIAYQSFGRGLELASILDLDRVACQGLRPDLTLLIDTDVDTALDRSRRRNDRTHNSESRIDEEGRGFHERVRRGYLSLAEREPDRIVVIDGRKSIGEVARGVRVALSSRV